jgi:hypothetical protein
MTRAVKKTKRQVAKPNKREPKNVRARMADVVIRIMVPPEFVDPPNTTVTTWNPRRPGTAAHDHLEKMKGGITIREYLAKFTADEQRTARQWLWNTIKDGHVKTLGG